jgi:HK97 family phage major capsid protein
MAMAESAVKPKVKHRPSKTFKRVVEVEQEISEAMGLAQAVYDRADGEKRGVTEDEFEIVKQQQEYCEYLENEVSPTVKAFEENVRRNAQRHFERNASPASQAAHVIDGFHMPGLRPNSGLPNVIAPRLQAFRSELFGGLQEAGAAATDAGHWFRAAMYQNRKSIEYCRERNRSRGDERYLPIENNFDERFDAQTVDDSTRGGVLVPTIVARTIIDVRDRYGLIANLARRYPMEGETDNVPKRAAGLTVYKPGEDTDITTSEKTYGTSVSLGAVDAYTLTKVSHKLMRGSVVSAADQVINEIGYAFAKQQDYEGINGDGTSGAPDFDILGAIPGIAAGGISQLEATNTTWADITAADIDKLMSTLPDRFYAQGPGGPEGGGAMGGPVFVCSRTFWGQVLQPIMTAAGGNTKFDLSAATPFQYAGFPVRFTEEMPTTTGVAQKCLLFGNFQEGMILGQRESIGISTSEHQYFAADQMAIRGRMSYDLKFHEKGDATNAGAIVVLQTAAS